MKVYWKQPHLKPNVRAVGFLSSNWILFIEREVNWEIIKNYSWEGPLCSQGSGPRSCCRIVPCSEGSNVLSTQVLNISTNSSPLGTPLHGAIDLAVRAFFLLFNLTFPFLHFIPFVFGNDLDKSVLTSENKKPCLCLPLCFPDPSTYGNMEIWEGGRQSSWCSFWMNSFPKAETLSLEPPGEHEGSLMPQKRAGYRGPDSWRQRGPSPGFPKLNSLLAWRLGQKVAAKHQALWAERSFRITQVPTFSLGGHV